MKRPISTFALWAMIICSATIPILGGKYLPHVTRIACVGCADCSRICPVKAITIKNGRSIIDPLLCIGCRKCVCICSYGAVR